MVKTNGSAMSVATKLSLPDGKELCLRREDMFCIIDNVRASFLLKIWLGNEKYLILHMCCSLAVIYSFGK